VQGLRQNMDEMAYTIATEVNRIHRAGYDRYNAKGVGFFNDLDRPQDAARSLEVNGVVAQDVGRIVAGAAPNAPGDNRIANLVSQLQYQDVLQGSTVDGFYNSMVGELGVRTRQANESAQSQKDILAQLNNIRESVSGVSLDEETTKMIEYQKSFDASARLIRTADEMMDTVLNLKRM
jgi:flagellar hook-associated protein 1 FlgK